MAYVSHRVALITVAGACLALSACGGSSTTAASAPAASSTSAPASSTVLLPARAHFCKDLNTMLNNVPSTSASKKLGAAAARKDLDRILYTGEIGYSDLEAEAPAQIRESIRTIIGVYQSDAKMAEGSGSVVEISKSLVRVHNGTGSDGAAFRKVLTYIRAGCK